MEIKYFRPFWSYDVKKFEEWLSYMANDGIILSRADFNLRIFTFEEGEPQKLTYRIQYLQSFDGNLPSGLLNVGWIVRTYNSRWCIAENIKGRADITVMPSRDGILKKNRIILYCFSVSLLLALLPIGFITLLILFVISGDGTFVDESGALGFIFTVLQVLPYIFAIYTIIRLLFGNKKLSKEVCLGQEVIPQNIYFASYDIKTGEKLYTEYKTFTRVRLAWAYSPDKIELWLRKMSERGFHLYKIGFFGNSFHFVKGDSKKIKYCLDYQNYTDKDYYELHKQAGWRQIDINNMNLMKWTIWVKEFEGDIEPALYSTNTDLTKHARRIAITYSLLSLPICAMYLWMITDHISSYLRHEYFDHLNWTLIIVFSLLILEYGSFAARSMLYYHRLKKITNEKNSFI